MKAFRLKNQFFKLALASLVLLFLSLPSFASNYSLKLNEAIYLFEMKGEYEEAQKILSEISQKGNAKERSEADFLLGKIKDIFGKKSNASFYYEQNLLYTKNAAQAYWEAERIALLNPAPENIIKKNLILPSPLKQVFFGDSVLILLDNHILYNTHSNTKTPIPTEIPEKAAILDISEIGIWWKLNNSLNFTPLQPIYPFQSIPLQKNLGDFLHISPHVIAYLDGEHLILRNGNTQRFKSNPKYQDCSIQEETFKKETLLLNCPDNALHVISKDNGQEISIISMLDAISKIHLDSSGILLFSGDGLWFFSPENYTTPQWRINSLSVEDIESLGAYFAILETSGHIVLLNKHSGEILLRKKTFANAVLPLHSGLLGLLSRDGNIQATDTLLRPLWNYNLGSSPIMTPWVQEGELFYPVSPDSIKILNILHYGKKPILSQTLAQKASYAVQKEDWEKALPLIDSALFLEPGNLEASFLKAIYLEKEKAPNAEKEKAWAHTIKLTAKGYTQTDKIFSHYAKIIGADFITPLPISQQTIYPQFFSHKKNLYSIDAASRQLIALNSNNGSLRFTQNVGKIESAPVTAHHKNWLVLGSGFNINVINLNQPSANKTFDLPGKIFHTSITSDYILVSTWNGFLVKITLPNFKQAWVRKISTEPIFSITHKENLLAITNNGEISLLQKNSGLPLNKRISLQAQITNIVPGDSAIAFISSDLRVLLFTNPEAPILTLSPEKEILSAAFVNHPEQGPSILLSLNNKELRLYSLPKGNILWRYRGAHSVFGKFALHNNSIWIDDKNHITEISLLNGKLLQKLPIAGDAGSPFIVDNMLFCATPQQLLFGFKLNKKNTPLE